MERPQAEITPPLCLKCRSQPGHIEIRDRTWYCQPCFIVLFSSKIKRALDTVLNREKDLNFRRKGDPLPGAALMLDNHRGSRVVLDALTAFYSRKSPNQPESTRAPLPFSKLVIFQGPRNDFESLPVLDEVAIEHVRLEGHDPLYKCQREEAIKRGCTLLLLPESATELAARTLACMAGGRGWSLSEDVGSEVVYDFAPMKLIQSRPLALIGNKEISAYLDARGLQKSDGVVQAGIRNVCDGFILSLNESFPSTVPTISRIIGKLRPRSTIEDVQMCLICGQPAQLTNHYWRNATSIFTREQATVQDSGTITPISRADDDNLVCFGCAAGQF